MTISSSLLSYLQLGNSSETSALSPLLSAQSTSVTSGVSGSPPTNDSGSDNVSLSDPAKLFSELKDLSQSNPTEFKKITAQIAQQLQSAAKDATDPNEASFLNDMSTNFSNASQSGKFSDLFPQQQPQTSQSGTSQSSGSEGAEGAHHHRHHGGGDDAVSQIFSSALAQIQSDLGSTSSASVSSTVATNTTTSQS